MTLLEKIKENHLVIIIILVLLLLLYVWNTSKTQVKTNTTISTISTMKPTIVSNKENFNGDKAEFTVYYTNWCGWSKRALAMLNSQEMTDYFTNNPKCELVLVDCESDTGKQMCEDNNVKGFPTMKLIVGNKKIDYNGDRSPNAIKDFIEKNA